MSEGQLVKEIAASLEDVKALLDDNRHLSIAFLWVRLKDIEREMRERFRAFEGTKTARLDSLEASVKKLEERIELAAVKFREMRDELDKLAERNKEKP